MNPFTAAQDWIDENADYALLGSGIGIVVSVALCFIFGGN